MEVEVPVRGEMGRISTAADLYLSLAITDARFSNPTVNWGTKGFTTDNASGGPPVSPCVLSWGELVRNLSSFESRRESTCEIELDPLATFVAQGGTTRYQVGRFIREANLRDAAVTIYQWNRASTTPEAIWRGYWDQIKEAGLREADKSSYPYAIIQLRGVPKSVEDPIGTLATELNFPSIPSNSKAGMVPRVYGDVDVPFQDFGNHNDPAMFSFPVPAAPGVVVSEQVDNAKMTVRFAQNDGTSAAHTIATGTADDNAGDATANTHLTDANALLVYDQDNSAYGLIEKASYSLTNDTSKVEADIDMGPIVHLGMRPTKLGTKNLFTAGGYKPVDEDPANFLLTTVSVYELAYECPRVQIKGRIINIRVGIIVKNVHATKQRRVRWGIWNVNEQGGANWLANNLGTPRNTFVTMGAGSGGRFYGFPIDTTHVVDGTMVGGPAVADFVSGNFVGHGTGEAVAPLQILVSVDDLGGADAGREDVRILGVCLAVKVQYDNLRLASTWVRAPGDEGKPWWKAKWQEGPKVVKGEKRDLNLEFLCAGAFQKDDGSGTYTGSANSLIEKLPDVFHHMAGKVKGYTVNNTAGTLGNVVDARADDQLGSFLVAGSFGPDQTSFDEFRRQLEREFPARTVLGPDGKWRIIPDRIWQHSSRLYRSTSDVRRISYRSDLLEGSFTWQERSFEEIENNVTVLYCIGQKNQRPLYSYNYRNDLSAKYFGVTKEITVEAPRINATTIGSGSHAQSAIDLAAWRADRRALPGLTLKMSLGQAFYDIAEGSVTELDSDWNESGVDCYAWRCGLPVYHYVGDGGLTDYADSAAPVFAPTAGSPKYTYLGFTQQVDEIWFNVGTAAAYTGNATWAYSVLGGTFTNFATQPGNRDGLKSTGLQKVTITRPLATSWVKSLQVLGGTLRGTIYRGPCYWVRIDFGTTVTNAGLGNGYTTHPARWAGRQIECIEIRRRPDSAYPYVDAKFQEVM